MKQILSDIGDLITGKSNTPPNPDVQHNVKLLQDAKLIVETGIFSKYFRRPYIVLMETVFYSATLFLLSLSIFFNYQLDQKLLDVKNLTSATDLLAGIFEVDSNLKELVSITQNTIIVISLLPSLLSFIIARSYTKSRRRLSKFIEVEAIIEKVIYNFWGK